MKTPDFELPLGVADAATALRRQLQRSRQRLPFAMSSLPWRGILAAVTTVLLLLSFQIVVRGVVQQAELRRKLAAAHADTVWRCKILPGRRARDRCLAQLDAAPHGAAPVQAQDIVTAAPVTQTSR